MFPNGGMGFACQGIEQTFCIDAAILEYYAGQFVKYALDDMEPAMRLTLIVPNKNKHKRAVKTCAVNSNPIIDMPAYKNRGAFLY